jgi:hypothetical protein
VFPCHYVLPSAGQLIKLRAHLGTPYAEHFSPEINKFVVSVLMEVEECLEMEEFGVLRENACQINYSS